MSVAEMNPYLNQQPTSAEVRYDLSDEEMAYLTAQLLQDPEFSISTENDFICVRVDGKSQYANLARTLEARVFSNELEDSPDAVKNDYSPYDSESQLLLVIDTPKGIPVGTMRIIEPSDKGFMVLNEIEGAPHSNETSLDVPFTTDEFYADYRINPEKTWEVGTIAVLPQNRRATQANLHVVEETQQDKAAQRMREYIVSGLLYRGLYAGAQANDIHHFVATIETQAYETLRGLGIPFYSIYDVVGKTYYSGFYYQPVVANVDDFSQEMRGFIDWNIKKAEAELKQLEDSASTKSTEIEKAAKNVRRLKLKLDMVNELLDGPNLDKLFAQDHKIDR